MVRKQDQRVGKAKKKRLPREHEHASVLRSCPHQQFPVDREDHPYEQHGDDNLGYYLLDWCEETLELVGLTLFASALLTRLTGRELRLTA